MIKSLRSQIYHVISFQGNNISLYIHNAILLNINYVLQNIIIHQNLVIFKDHLVKICFLWEMDYSCHFCLNIYMYRKGYKNIYRSYISWCSKIVTVFVLFFVFACLCSLKSSELSIEIQHNYIFLKMLLSLKRYLLQVFRDSILNNCIAMTDSRDAMDNAMSLNQCLWNSWYRVSPNTVFFIRYLKPHQIFLEVILTSILRQNLRKINLI